MSELGPSPFWTVHREKILSNYVVTKFGNEYPVYV